MHSRLAKRQTPALDSCSYVSFGAYDWRDILQCNLFDHGVKIHWNPAVYCIIATTAALTIYMCLEILVRTLLRFKSWKSLYFWSLICTCIGQIGAEVAQILLDFVLPHQSNNAGMDILSVLSSILGRTGLSTVIYSRLHFVCQNRLVLRGLLVLLIIDAIGLHSPTIASIVVGARGTLIEAYNLYNHVVYVDIGFSVQESLFSGFYIWYFWRYLNDIPEYAEKAFKREKRITFASLVAVWVIITSFDVLTIILLCQKLILARNTVGGLMDAVKLNLEFVVLNRLVGVVETKRAIMAQGDMVESNPEQEPNAVRAHDQEETEVVGDTTDLYLSLLVPRIGSPTLMHNRLPVRWIAAPVQELVSENDLEPVPTSRMQFSTYLGQEQDDGVDELERRYLGRFGL